MKKVLLVSLAVCAWAGDAQRGSVVVDEQGCLECHTVNRQGIGHEANATASDLAGNPGSVYTPASLASGLWNHTPEMWNQVSAQRLGRPALAEADWQDVFAYLYSIRILQFPADTRHGQEVFSSKKCADCHSPGKSGRGAGPPVSAWKKVDDPGALVYQMWNHAAAMKKVFAARKTDWPALDGRDFLDLAAYIQNLQKLAPQHGLSLPEAASGKIPFEHNCQLCHQGPRALETRLANKTFLDIGAGVWNHVPLMGPFPTVSEADMRKILAYVWELQYRGPEGNVTQGQLAFAAKGCAVCHIDPATQAVMSPQPGKVFTPFSMAAIAWGPTRSMHQQMRAKGVDWPALSPENISDLTAYLNYVSGK
jgi:mono/diheme cytochrome c family protein